MCTCSMSLKSCSGWTTALAHTRLRGGGAMKAHCCQHRTKSLQTGSWHVWREGEQQRGKFQVRTPGRPRRAELMHSDSWNSLLHTHTRAHMLTHARMHADRHTHTHTRTCADTHMAQAAAAWPLQFNVSTCACGHMIASKETPGLCRKYIVTKPPSHATGAHQAMPLGPINPRH